MGAAHRAPQLGTSGFFFFFLGFSPHRQEPELGARSLHEVQRQVSAAVVAEPLPIVRLWERLVVGGDRRIGVGVGGTARFFQCVVMPEPIPVGNKLSGEDGSAIFGDELAERGAASGGKICGRKPRVVPR
ncbi:hypothetical protein U1Q18_022886 [Sarracenia purpurea var. burkii]